MKKPRPSPYARDRFSAEVISLAVGLYFRFPLYLQILAEAGRRSGWVRARRACPEPPQWEGGQMSADQIDEEAKHGTQAHHHC
jgi:putative transposase